MKKITKEEEQLVLEKQRDFVNALYEDRDLIEEILQQLNHDWKIGKNIIPQLGVLQERNSALIVLYEYLYLTAEGREEMENRLGIAGTEVALFLSALAQKYADLRTLVYDHLLHSAGVKNHLLRYGPEGIFFDAQRGMLLARFSVYTAGERLMQSTDHVDDLVWLATRLLDQVNDALESCRESGAQLSDDYWSQIRSRNTFLTEQYMRHQDLLGNEKSVADISSFDFDSDVAQADDDLEI